MFHPESGLRDNENLNNEEKGKSPEILAVEKSLPKIEEMDGGAKFLGAVDLMIENLRAKEIPVEKNGRLRLSMDKFIPLETLSEEEAEKEIGTIEQRQKTCQKLEEIWKREGNFGGGEALEMVMTYIFQADYGEDIVAVRTTKWDDYQNGIDTIFVDKKKGIIGALDGIGATFGENYDNKLRDVERKNKNGGARLDYAIWYKDGKLEKGAIGNGVPVLYLALRRDWIKAAVKHFNEPLVRRVISDHIMDEFQPQIKNLYKLVGKQEFSPHVDDDCRQRMAGNISSFERLMRDKGH
jgi:hypothetical protein